MPQGSVGGECVDRDGRRGSRALLAVGLAVAGLAAQVASARAPEAAPHALPPAGGPVCSEAEDPTAPSPAQRHALRCLINVTRRRAGLAPLRLSSILSASAALKAQDVKRCAELAHTACGKEARAAAEEAGYPDERSWGEILYVAVDGGRAPEDALDRWLASSPHRRMLLDPRWTEAGAGLLRDRDADLERAIWVVHFGGR